MRNNTLKRVLVAFALCATPASTAGQAGAEPPVALCAPVAAACVAADVTPCATDACLAARADVRACAPDELGCVAGAARACPPGSCTAVTADACLPRRLADVCATLGPLGGIERPALGTITIHEDSTGVTTKLTGVYDPAAGFFDCVTYVPLNAQRTVRCVEKPSSYDWYCAGWVVTATTHIYNSQVAGQASCADYQGFPGQSSYQTLATDFACCNGTEQASAANLWWFVQGAVTCQAWGYSGGPRPMGEYTVTCNEPGGYTSVRDGS